MQSGKKAENDVDRQVDVGSKGISPPKPHPHAGWAEEVKLVNADNEPLDWLEFGNEEDAALAW